MKKLIIYIILVVVIMFLIPIIFTKRFKKVEEVVNYEEKEISNYDYKEYKTIRLLHSKTGIVEELELDEYLKRSSCKRNAC